MELNDGVLYRNWESDDGTATRSLLVVPRELVHDILPLMHDIPSAGHLGITKTIAKIRERFYWIGLDRAVEDWCRRCELCAKRKPPRKASRSPLVTVQPGYPLKRVALDILGPLPESDSGNKYIMVVGDYFTKWTEAYPIPNQEAVTVTRKLVDEFVSRFGAPEHLHSDQGRNFESSLFKEACKLLGIVKTRKCPYHPESDGIIERFNRTVLSMLSNYVDDRQRDWDRHLPHVMMAYRSCVHESTKYTPFYMIFGRDVKLPVDVIFGRTPDQPQERVEYARHLRDSLEAAHHLARTHLQAAQRRQKDFYDRRVAGSPFSVGDRVLLSSTAVKRGLSPKLHPKWRGPYIVLAKINDVNYRVQLATGQGRHQVVHFNRLRPCNFTGPLPDQRGEGEDSSDEEPVQGTNGYVPDATDALYPDDGSSADEDERREGHSGDVRPSRQRRRPAYLRDYTSWSDEHSCFF